MQMGVDINAWLVSRSLCESKKEEDAGNAAGMTEQMFSSAFNSMGNGLATFVTTGKLNFKSFTSSLLSDLAKIMAQMAMMQAVKGIGSALGFDFKANADGGVYQSASLSRYRGSVVDRPTFFAFARGAGVMGEADQRLFYRLDGVQMVNLVLSLREWGEGDVCTAVPYCHQQRCRQRTDWIRGI